MKRNGVNSDFIEKVKQANNIVNIAGRYLTLKAKGKTQWACCPFHHEKTPSFAINEMQQYYHCFGCGVSGDVITLTQQLESLDFYGALELLAKNSGIEMPAVVYDEEYAKTAKKKQRILSALGAVCEFYCKKLYEEKNRAYLEYLHSRGITDELIKLFNIGACSDWNESVKYLKAKGFTENELIDAGIAVRSEKGNLYDVMGMRIPFAIFNIYGDCIGFSGRTMSADKEIAKYKNTAQTIAFDKGSIVYGIDVMKKNKLTNFVDKLIIVEGNVDVISLVGAGFKNVVACMGTALTQYHARIFKRFSDQVYICFDGDSAGQKATLRGLDILAAENLDVRVVSIPDELDPDDYIRKHGKEGFSDLLSQAMPLIDFKLEYEKKNNDFKDNIDKTRYLENAIKILKELAMRPELELYIPRVAATAGVSFDAVSRAILAAAAGESAKAVPSASGIINEQAQLKGNEASEIPVTPASSAYARSLQFVIASILHNKEYAKPADFIDTGNYLYKKIVDKVTEFNKDNKEWKVGFVFTEFDEHECAQLDSLINFSFEVEQEAAEKYYKDCINYLEKANLQRQIDELKQKYKETEEIAEKNNIMIKIQEINKRIKQNGKK